MAEHADLPADWWADNLEDLDREIVRLATLCQVKILDLGAMERVLRNDAAVCGTSNPAAFAKLRQMLMMHLALREKSLEALGEAKTVAIEREIIERLSKSYPELGQWPPA
jgi:hypothetical protein